ncbi:NAD-dependent epimerase/dehydratase family protein [bacterium]|nr:NAD-dependent epimerase/dehydratase family protein [bacterium]
MSKKIERILVTGACGQIGTELCFALGEKYGAENVIASDIRPSEEVNIKNIGAYEFCDVTKYEQIAAIIDQHKIDTVFHMAAILSAVGEKNPFLCWDVNMNGTINTLKCAIDKNLTRVIIPSSIAAFGPDTPRDNTPNDTILRPTSMYGVTKVCAERLCDYYVKRFGIDVRGLRYPGIISSETLPGGGTTDYAVEIYYKAVSEGSYQCFLSENTMLPMMYMPDCIKATLDLAEAPLEKIEHHSDFNLAAFSVTPAGITESIKKYIPEFNCTYKPDYRQPIADSWPNSIDDSIARNEWDWKPDWDLDSMTRDMLEKLKKRFEEGKLY